MKKLFYLPIFTLVLISNTFSDNTVKQNPQVSNNIIYNRAKMFENSSLVKQQMPMQNNIKQMPKERINRFERKNNNLPNRNMPKTNIVQSNKIKNTAQMFSKTAPNKNQQPFNNKPRLQVNRSNNIINTAQNFSKPVPQTRPVNTKAPGKLKMSADQRKKMTEIVGQHNNMLAQYHINNPSSYTMLNNKPMSSNKLIKPNNTVQNPNQARLQERLMKDKQQALNNKQPVKNINRPVLQQQPVLNTNSPIHKELAQQYSNRANTSIMSQLQNIVKQVNNNTSDKDITALTNTWNNIINEAKNAKFSKEYINNAIQTVINSNINNIQTSKFYEGILKDV